MGCIYRIVCGATGKSYIGQTAYSHPFVRYVEHQRDAQKGKEGPLYEDLRTYGVHAFVCECVCVAGNEALNELEWGIMRNSMGRTCGMAGTTQPSVVGHLCGRR